MTEHSAEKNRVLNVLRDHQYLSDEEGSGYGWCSCDEHMAQDEHFAHVAAQVYPPEETGASGE